jgi:Domain of Unknown Function (DUF1080)
MMRTNCALCIELSTALVISWAVVARGEDPAKETAPAAATPEALKVESKSAPIKVPDEVLKKMTVLFDGKNLDGWEYDPQAWHIVDGAMRGTGKGGNIWTKGNYGNFRLIVTSRVANPPGDDGHNHLGILFWGDRPSEGKYGTNNALQVQPPHGAMWDYHRGKGNIKVERDASFKKPSYQDWHVGEILANIDTGEIRFANDGVEVMHYKYPDLSALKKGPIGMQIHAAGGIFDHKDICVEADPKEDKLLTVKQ